MAGDLIVIGVKAARNFCKVVPVAGLAQLLEPINAQAISNKFTHPLLQKLFNVRADARVVKLQSQRPIVNVAFQHVATGLRSGGVDASQLAQAKAFCGILHSSVGGTICGSVGGAPGKRRQQQRGNEESMKTIHTAIFPEYAANAYLPICRVSVR